MQKGVTMMPVFGNVRYGLGKYLSSDTWLHASTRLNFDIIALQEYIYIYTRERNN